MTRAEYCKLKGLHICNPKFNLNDELDEDFKKQIDDLLDDIDEVIGEQEVEGGEIN